MNKANFSYPGILPFDQDGFDFLQSAWLDGFNAPFADAGTTPVILSGVNYLGLGGPGNTFDTWSAGHFYYNGEIWYLPAGAISALVLPPVGYVTVVTLIESPTAIVFEDGSSHNAYLQRRGQLTQAPVSASNLDFGTFKRWHEVFGTVARGAGFATSTVAGGYLAGTISWRKNSLTNTLHLKGALTVTPPNTEIANPPYYSFASGAGFAVLPANCCPADVAQFRAFFRYHGTNMPQAGSGDYVQGVNAELLPTGEISLGLVLPNPAVAYDLKFNCIIPLD